MLDFNQDSAKTVVRRKYEDSIGKTRLDRVKSVSTTERGVWHVPVPCHTQELFNRYMQSLELQSVEEWSSQLDEAEEEMAIEAIEEVEMPALPANVDW